MGIQSTVHISRPLTISRIATIMLLVEDCDYREIEGMSFESEHDVMDFVKDHQDLDISKITKWTNKMIEDVIDRPFFRNSMFDNYSVED